MLNTHDLLLLLYWMPRLTEPRVPPSLFLVIIPVVIR